MCKIEIKIYRFQRIILTIKNSQPKNHVSNQYLLQTIITLSLPKLLKIEKKTKKLTKKKEKLERKISGKRLGM